MARRQRYNSRTVHMPRKPEKLFDQHGKHVLNKDTGAEVYRVYALCGDEYSYHDRASPEIPERWNYSDYQTFTNDPLDHRICSRCQSKTLHKMYGGRFEGLQIGERIDLSRSTIPHGISKWSWKSVYPVIDTRVLADIDDQRKIVGFICIESGWGKAWQIHSWSSVFTYGDFERGKMPEPKMNGDHAKYTEVRESYTRYGTSEVEPRREWINDAKGIASKEAALLLIPDMIARGQLRSYQACLDSDVQSRDAFAQSQRERQAQREAAVECQRQQLEKLEADKSHVEDAFRSMIDDETLLSNFQR